MISFCIRRRTPWAIALAALVCALPVPLAAQAITFLVIVAMTGWGGGSDKRATREAGFDDHRVKLIDPEELRKLLRRCR
ncbi:MAG: hypothetical protein WBA53_09985 [Burkholderiaceae bacterium]